MRKSVWLLSAGIVAISAAGICAGQSGNTDTNRASPTEQAAVTPEAQAGADLDADNGEIIITAQGRRQVLQDVPIAVTAVGGGRDAEFRRHRHPPAEPARAVAAGFLDRHGSRTARPVSAASARSATIPASKARSPCSSTASIARVRASASTNWASSTGSKCCAVRRAPCSAATPLPASSISSRKPHCTSSGGLRRSRPSAITISAASQAASPAGFSDTLAARLDGVYVQRDGF